MEEQLVEKELMELEVELWQEKVYFLEEHLLVEVHLPLVEERLGQEVVLFDLVEVLLQH